MVVVVVVTMIVASNFIGGGCSEAVEVCIYQSHCMQACCQPPDWEGDEVSFQILQRISERYQHFMPCLLVCVS